MRDSFLRLTIALVACCALSACGKEASDDDAPALSATRSPDATRKLNAKDRDATPKTYAARALAEGQGTLSKDGAFRAAVTTWTAGPSVTLGEDGRNAFQITVARPDGTKPSSVTVREVFPYMKMHGHGSPKAYQPVVELKENMLSVTRLGFIMSGPWEVNVRLVVDGREDIAEIPVEVP